MEAAVVIVVVVVMLIVAAVTVVVVVMLIVAAVTVVGVVMLIVAVVTVVGVVLLIVAVVTVVGVVLLINDDVLTLLSLWLILLLPLQNKFRLQSWMNSRIALSQQASRFELPMDMKLLEREYLLNGSVTVSCLLKGLSLKVVC